MAVYLNSPERAAVRNKIQDVITPHLANLDHDDKGYTRFLEKTIRSKVVTVMEKMHKDNEIFDYIMTDVCAMRSSIIVELRLKMDRGDKFATLFASAGLEKVKKKDLSGAFDAAMKGI